MAYDALADDQFDQALRGRLFDVLTALPGRVLAFNRTAGTVDVQPLPATMQDGEPVAWPILRDVPVAWPRGGGAAITWPLQAGDYVQLQFQARSIEQFLHGDGDEGDPQNPRTHHLADAVALPGVWPSGSRLSPAPPAGTLELREPPGGLVHLGQGATKGVAGQGDAVSVSLTAVDTAAFTTYQATVAAWIAGGSVPPAPPPFPMSGTITGGSSVVKVK